MWAPKLTWQGHKKRRKSIKNLNFETINNANSDSEAPSNGHFTILWYYHQWKLTDDWALWANCPPNCVLSKARSWEGGGGSKQEGWFETSPSWLWTIGTPISCEVSKRGDKKWVIDWFDWFKVIKLSLSYKSGISGQQKKRAN